LQIEPNLLWAGINPAATAGVEHNCRQPVHHALCLMRYAFPFTFILSPLRHLSAGGGFIIPCLQSAGGFDIRYSLFYLLFPTSAFPLPTSKFPLPHSHFQLLPYSHFRIPTSEFETSSIFLSPSIAAAGGRNYEQRSPAGQNFLIFFGQMPIIVTGAKIYLSGIQAEIQSTGIIVKGKSHV
jgi:hypothetical protein